MIGQKQKHILVGLLGVSLILNFAAAGYIGSRLVRDRVTSSVGAGLEQPPSPALADAYGKALAEDRKQLAPAFLKLRRARKEQQDILTAEIYDAEAHARAQAETRRRIDDVLTLLHGALRKTATRLPDAERRAIPPFKIKPFQHPDGSN